MHKHNKHYDCLSVKIRPGMGGINCPCCTKVPPDELKVMSRRAYRRTVEKSILREALNDLTE